ncbi:MAG: hypothetical protein HQL04_00355 [Nitrospirae bacterium]|nr:hypothetical protein [Nitrospirota bacterium]
MAYHLAQNIKLAKITLEMYNYRHGNDQYAKDTKHPQKSAESHQMSAPKDICSETSDVFLDLSIIHHTLAEFKPMFYEILAYTNNIARKNDVVA